MPPQKRNYPKIRFPTSALIHWNNALTKNFFRSKAPNIFIRDLTLEYQHHLLFQKFNLDLLAGCWTAILGASGVGKTTLLKLLAGLPTGVDQSVAAGVIATSDHQPLSGRVAYMAQQDLLMPWLTVVDNCLIGYRLRGQRVSAQERKRAVDLLQQVGLAHAATWRIARLSAGMRQRVALVRTLLEERPVVLMDEPFSALDALTRLTLQDLAAEWLAGKTVLLVTHDPLEALRLADQICVLSGAPARARMTVPPPSLTRPRSPQDPQLLAQQGELLTLLAS
jgi:putative hydroxymethylpyrimidine transport system ATP-binding protein